MNSTLQPERKRLRLTAGLSAVMALVACGGYVVGQQGGEAPVLTPAEIEVLQAVRAQQKQIIANMQKIESEMALATEDVRQARIFTSRGGR